MSDSPQCQRLGIEKKLQVDGKANNGSYRQAPQQIDRDTDPDINMEPPNPKRRIPYRRFSLTLHKCQMLQKRRVRSSINMIVGAENMIVQYDCCIHDGQ